MTYYFVQIMTVPRLAQRIECMIYRRKLDLEIEEIRPELNIIRNASRELRSSSRLKAVLQVYPIFIVFPFLGLILQQVVLAIGNALNGSSFRGGARGFQLEALSKVKFLLRAPPI